MRLHLVLWLAVLSCQSALAGQWGQYVGEVVAKWDIGGREMTLVQDFAFRDSKGELWSAPTGSTVDGASIPRFAWTVIGGPFEGNYRDASVIHDVACDRKVEPWERVHEVFYEAMLASSVDPLKARIMYGAVYHFGPRWSRAFKYEEVPLEEAGREIHLFASRSDDTQTVIATAENRRRIGGGGRPLASQDDDPPRDVVDLSVRITPKSSPLRVKDFNELQAAIEAKGLSLEQIRRFRP